MKTPSDPARAIGIQATGRSQSVRPDGVLLRAIEGTDICIYYEDVGGCLRWIENVSDGIAAQDLVSAQSAGAVTNSSERLAAIKQAVRATGVSEFAELEIETAGGPRFFDIWIHADVDDYGAVEGLLCTSIDKTEERRREQAMRVLLREVSHRTGNLLAIISSLARQTRQHARGLDDFLPAFLGRLRALGSSQHAVTDEGWCGVPLLRLIENAGAEHVDEITDYVDLDGPNPIFAPNTATHVGLALHELVLNSRLAGTLSRDEGTIDVSVIVAKLEDASDQEMITLRWTERFAVCAHPSRPIRDFLRHTLEVVVPRAIGGAGTLELNETELAYELAIPVERTDSGSTSNEVIKGDRRTTR